MRCGASGRLAIRLMHAHIVRTFEFHDDDGSAFYSLQFIDGPDISVLAGAAPEESMPAVALIADALRYAHGKGVVHRDIKASNIMLDRNGAPYLIDFGVAATGGADIGGGSLISASPQQLAGETAQPGDDIFALGGLIFELVSGRSPWSSATTADDIRGKEAPPPARAGTASRLPRRSPRLFNVCSTKDAAARPDAESVAAELAQMGFAPAPVPTRFVAAARAAGDELIESTDTVRPVKRERARATPTAAAASSGVSPRTLGIGLGVLILVLLGVVFLLPRAVDRDPAEPVAGTPVEEDVTTESEIDRDDGDVGFNENIEDLSGRDQRVQDRGATEEILGELLSKMDVLEGRAVQRWGGVRYARAQAIYGEGDEGVSRA